jgi:hypothetical protein
MQTLRDISRTLLIVLLIIKPPNEFESYKMDHVKLFSCC